MLSRSGRRQIAASASPAFSAIGDAVLLVQRGLASAPCALPSSMSSWMRNAAWRSSTAAAQCSASSTVPPNASHAARHNAGRMPFPGRIVNERTGS